MYDFSFTIPPSFAKHSYLYEMLGGGSFDGKDLGSPAHPS